jgi:hypothetical protein
LTSLIVNLNKDTGTAIGKGINGMAIGGAGSPLYLTLVGSQVHTVNAITAALNSNTTFMDALIKALDSKALAQTLNDALGNSQFLVQNLANMDAGVLNKVTNNAALNLLKNLIGVNPDPGPLRGDLVARALNGGMEHLLATSLGTLNGKDTALISNDTAFPLLNQMLNSSPGSADVISSSIQNSCNTGTGLWGHLAMNVTMITSLLGIPITAKSSAYVTGSWANSWPDPPGGAGAWPGGP